MFIAILLLAGCQTTPTVIEPTPENVAAQFESVAFGSDFGGALNRLQRWTGAPTWQLYANEADITPHEEVFNRTLAGIRDGTGYLIDVPADGADASLHVAFIPQRDFRAAIPPRIDRAGFDYESFISDNACLGATLGPKTAPGEITYGIILIGTDIPADLREHCILEEFVQIMGLPADACHYRPSLFCERDRVYAMTEADKILLRTLYDPRLKPGMTKAEAMPIAREIIAEQMR